MTNTRRKKPAILAGSHVTHALNLNFEKAFVDDNESCESKQKPRKNTLQPLAVKLLRPPGTNHDARNH